jgi:hypothetical protein
VPFSEIIKELEERRKELEAETAELEARIAAMKVKQAEGVKDGTRIISGVEVVERAPQPD